MTELDLDGRPGQLGRASACYALTVRERADATRWLKGLKRRKGGQAYCEPGLTRTNGDVEVGTYLTAAGAVVTVECRAAGARFYRAFVTRERFAEAALTFGDVRTMSKYLKAAAVAVKAKGSKSLTCNDPVVFANRPAVREFMTLVEDDDGKERDTSIIMICPDEANFRVGLNSGEQGVWCWRVGSTVAEALDAIEKALQGGQGAFKEAGGRKGRKK